MKARSSIFRLCVIETEVIISYLNDQTFEIPSVNSTQTERALGRHCEVALGGIGRERLPVSQCFEKFLPCEEERVILYFQIQNLNCEGTHAMEGEAKIPAVKLFISQLGVAKQALGAAGLVGLVLHSVEFTRVWLQVRECNTECTALLHWHHSISVSIIACTTKYCTTTPAVTTVTLQQSTYRQQ